MKTHKNLKKLSEFTCWWLTRNNFVNNLLSCNAHQPQRQERITASEGNFKIENSRKSTRKIQLLEKRIAYSLTLKNFQGDANVKDVDVGKVKTCWNWNIYKASEREVFLMCFFTFCYTIFSIASIFTVKVSSFSFRKRVETQDRKKDEKASKEHVCTYFKIAFILALMKCGGLEHWSVECIK